MLILSKLPLQRVIMFFTCPIALSICPFDWLYRAELKLLSISYFSLNLFITTDLKMLYQGYQTGKNKLIMRNILIRCSIFRQLSNFDPFAKVINNNLIFSTKNSYYICSTFSNGLDGTSCDLSSILHGNLQVIKHSSHLLTMLSISALIFRQYKNILLSFLKLYI